MQTAAAMRLDPVLDLQGLARGSASFPSFHVVKTFKYGRVAVQSRMRGLLDAQAAGWVAVLLYYTSMKFGIKHG